MTEPDEAEPDEHVRFTALYHAQYPRVFGYAVARVGRHQADEVVAETFLVAWRRFGDLPLEPLPWLLVTARNVISEQYRAEVRRQAMQRQIEEWATGRGDDQTADVADEVADRAAALWALSTLPEDDIELLTLVSWHGLSNRQVAQILGCSVATFFVRLHRARKRLSRAMVAGGGIPLPTRTPRQPGPCLSPQTEEYVR